MFPLNTQRESYRSSYRATLFMVGLGIGEPKEL